MDRQATPKDIAQPEVMTSFEQQTAPEVTLDSVLDLVTRLHDQGYDADEVDLIVREFVDEHREHLDSIHFGLVLDRGGQVLYLDRGTLVKHDIESPQAARQLLDTIKQRDIEEAPTVHSYGLRSALFREVKGDSDIMTTSDAFTYGPLPEKKRLKNHLDNESNWLPERAELHRVLAEQYVGECLDMHNRVASHYGDQRVLVLLRGNTAAGKTTALRSNPEFAHLLDEQGTPTGAVNIDNYKYHLKQHEAGRHGRKAATNQQVHDEGSLVKRKMIGELRSRHGQDLNEVVDSRFCELGEDVEPAFVRAREENKKLVILDINVGLMTSCLRVLGREINGEDPNATFGAVSGGYRHMHESGLGLMGLVEEHDEMVASYVHVHAHDTVGNTRTYTIAEMYDNIDELVQMDTQVDATVESVRATVIDDEFIEQVRSEFGSYGQRVVAALEEMKGMTIEQAMNARSIRLE